MKNYSFESEFPVRGIDPASGIVRGATICTAGIEAKGHGLKTDHVLLRQLLTSAKSKGTIPVGLDHKSGVKGAAGAAKNWRIVGNKLLADIQFFKTHQDFPLVMDQLSELGGTMGISASFVGDAENGLARCTDLLSADICLHPAANPTGLFSTNFDDPLNENSDHDETTDGDDDMHDEPNEDEIAELLHEVLGHLERLEAENAELKDALNELLSDEDDEDDTEGDDDDSEAVLEESGARSGPHTHDHRALLQSVDFESRITELQSTGLDPKTAHIRALQEWARSHYSVLNL